MATNGMEEPNEQENIPAQAPPPPVPRTNAAAESPISRVKHLLAEKNA